MLFEHWSIFCVLANFPFTKLFCRGTMSAYTHTMSEDYTSEITTFLNAGDSIDQGDQSKLYSLIYKDLKNIARNRLAAEYKQGTLTVTALVHEAFIKLDNVDSITWKNRRHYFGAAAEAMRRILIDRARYHSRQRREGEKNAIEFDEGIQVEGVKASELIELDDALEELESFDEEMAMIVKLKYFAGLSAEEIAPLTELSARTVSRKLQTARAWLLVQMKPD